MKTPVSFNFFFLNLIAKNARDAKVEDKQKLLRAHRALRD